MTNNFDMFVELSSQEALSIDGGGPIEKFWYGYGYFCAAWYDFWENVGIGVYDGLH